MKARYLPFLALFFVFVLPQGPAAADMARTPDQPRVGLALGSGGAGGLSQIAMLRVFDEQGIEPARISGTSIGAVIGALYAAGLSADEMEDIFDDFAGSEFDALSGIVNSDIGLTDLLSLGLDEGGILDSSGFIDFIAEQVDARRFEDLAIPLTVVATDFWTGESVIIEEGDLFEAVKASMAVPGLFAPVRRGDQLLVDGGTSKPLPYDLLMDDCDKVVAVDVSGNRKRDEENAELTDLLFKTFELMQQSIIREMRRHQEPDLYIKVDTSGIRLLHFNRLETILEQAKPAAEELETTLQSWTEG